MIPADALILWAAVAALVWRAGFPAAPSAVVASCATLGAFLAVPAGAWPLLHVAVGLAGFVLVARWLWWRQDDERRAELAARWRSAPARWRQARTLADVRALGGGREDQGWPAWIDAHGRWCRTVAVAEDPGNPGKAATIREVPAWLFGARTRFLIVTDASPAADGTRYALPIPADERDPVRALAATGGATPAQLLTIERAT